MPKAILKKIDLNNLISRSINLHELSAHTDIKFFLSKEKSLHI